MPQDPGHPRSSFEAAPLTAPTGVHNLRFGPFELQPHERRLLRDGEPVALGARAFDVLLALAERPGRLVGKRQLMQLVWPGLVVQDNNLAAQVSALRKVVGEPVIATIPGRGYRFVAHIETGMATPSEPAPRAVPESVSPTLRTNLPLELPALIGRVDDVAAIAALVDGHRLVSVVGAGGIGKSLVVQHLLRSRRGVYAQGVCWVELASVAEAAALPATLATALGVDCGHGEPLRGLVAALAPLSMLLALDNAEHLLDAVAALVKALHEGAPGLRIVVTSQAPLKLGPERVYRIGPLAVPPGSLPATQAMTFGAVALFAERAQAVDGRFALDEGNVATVTEICRALDGLPLAIELAAARAPTLGVQALLATMKERLRVLTASRDRAAPARQQTLRAALEWSDALLAPREQQVFRRLGVIAGSASLVLIQRVLGGAEAEGGLDAWAVLDAVDALVDRSLVAVLPASGEEAPRYRLPESARAYALERLDAAGERALLERRHAGAVASMLDAAYEAYFSGRVGADAWVRRLEPDFDNARDALHWARCAGDAEVELRIGSTMLRALHHSLHAQLIELADACEARVDATLPEPLQYKAWLELSCVLSDPQKQRGRRAAECALALARRLDGAQPDRFALYHALARAASAAAQANDLKAARVLIDEAQRLTDAGWPAQRVVWGEEAAQWVARMSGDTDGALERGRRLLALDRERGSSAAIAAGNLVDAELAAGDAASAVNSGRALVEALLGTRHEYGLAFARINLLAALLALDDVAQARPVAQAAQAKAVQFDLQHAAAAYLALLAALEGRPHAAAQLVGFSEARYAARNEARERNETLATQRARALAEGALGAAEFERLHAQGQRLRDADVAALASGDDAATKT